MYCFCSLPLTRGEEEKKKKKKKLHHHQCLGEMNKDIKEHTQGSGGGRQHPRKGFKKKGGGYFLSCLLKKGGIPATRDFSLSTQCPGVSGFPVYILLQGCSSSSLHPSYHGARECFIKVRGKRVGLYNNYTLAFRSRQMSGLQ